jgi:hypothetical protein
MLDRLDRAEAEAAVLAEDDPALYGLLVPAWRGDPGAWAALEAEAQRRPLDISVISWARFVAVHRGDDATAERFGRWLAIANYGGPSVARLVLGRAEPTPAGVIDGYGALYRRQVLRAQVVTLLPQLVKLDRP